MVIELVKKRDWNDTAFDIFYRFGMITIICIIVAGVLSATGGAVTFTNGDNNALTITVDDLITAALISFGISMIAFFVPILYILCYTNVLEKRKKK